MSDKHLRRQLIRVAHSLPKGSDERKKVLALLKEGAQAPIPVDTKAIIADIKETWGEFAAVESMLMKMGVGLESWSANPKVKIVKLEIGEEDMQVQADVDGVLWLDLDPVINKRTMDGVKDAALKVEIKGMWFTFVRRASPQMWK
jgi:hypothetical protein